MRRTLLCRVWMCFIVKGAAPPHIGAAYVIAGRTSDLYKCRVVLRLRQTCTAFCTFTDLRSCVRATRVQMRKSKKGGDETQSRSGDHQSECAIRKTSSLPAKLHTPHYLHFQRCHGQAIGSQVQNARGSRLCAGLG